MGKPIGDADLDLIFRTARTRRGWTEEETPEVLIRATYDLLKMAPTASNICPARFMFVHSPEAKARLKAKHKMLADMIESIPLIASADSPRPVLEQHAIRCRGIVAEQPRFQTHAVEWLFSDPLHSREIDESLVKINSRGNRRNNSARRDLSRPTYE